MKTILLTRSETENTAAARKLSVFGYESYSAPMISYHDLQYNFNQPNKHIIITSKHAAQLASKNVANPVECWVVGEESASILRKNKNITITGLARNLKHLMEAISLVQEDEAEEFFGGSIYLSGDIITQELPRHIKRDIIYETRYIKTIPEETIEAIKKDAINYIMVFSKNSAINLIETLTQHDLLKHLKHSTVIGISREVAILFSDICQKILYSEDATFSQMLELLDNDE
jgi:uroporphyrinogen-III synthase